MRNIWTVAKREYLTRVKTRWFLFASLAVPVLMGAFIGSQILLGQRSQEAARTLVVVDETGVLAAAVSETLEAGSFTVREQRSSLGNEAELQRSVEEKEIGGYLLLDGETLASGRAVYRSDDPPGTLTGFSIQQSVSRAVLEVRLSQQGNAEQARALARGGELEVRLFDEADDAEASRRAGLLIAFIGSMLLYFVILIYGVAVMRSVLEEKTSRVVEVVISAIRPRELLMGKLLGVGSVGLTQIAIWVGFVAVLGLFGLPALLAANPEMVEMEAVWNLLRGSGVLILFLWFFVAGYFLYSALYAAVGAMCSSEEETQQAQLPVTMLVVVPVLVMTQIADSPDALSSVLLSLFPFFSPILMFARVAQGGVPMWQIVLSAGLMIVTTVGMIWLAGRIYKVGILMQGKRPSVPELWRWIRQA